MTKMGKPQDGCPPMADVFLLILGVLGGTLLYLAVLLLDRRR
jgi:hypothetical protein